MKAPRSRSGPLPPIDLSVPADERRRALVETYSQFVYGRTPSGGGLGSVRLRASSEPAPGVVREEWELAVDAPLGGVTVGLLIHRPVADEDAPVFLGLNFKGNHATITSGDVRVSSAPSWEPVFNGAAPAAAPSVPLGEVPDIGWRQKPPAAPGDEYSRWPWEEVTAAGFALATLHAGEFEPDGPDGAALGIRGLFGDVNSRAPDHWGAVGAWAWGLSRGLDALTHVPGVDAGRVAVIGHSRLGKAALWAALQDPRFAMVVSNDSGCGGAALFRDKQGEDVRSITTVFPGWFAPTFASFSGREDELPIDQHQLLAAFAPRPTYVASAEDDLWADPGNEYLAMVHARPAFVREGGALGYHCRAGAHDITGEDWGHFVRFASEHVVGAQPR